MTEQVGHEWAGGASERARREQKAFYDARYGDDYMGAFDESGLSSEGGGAVDVFETCRRRTILATLRRLRADGVAPGTILDYGGGQGRYVPVWREAFPEAKLSLADISDAALARVRERFPEVRCVAMADEAVPLPDASIDFVAAVEVLEHVADVAKAAREIGRLLKPGGVALVTTPCANPGSAEWLHNRLRGGIQPTPDRYVRFATDEPGHLRRLTDRNLRELLAAGGVRSVRIDHRAQILTTVVAWGPLVRRLPLRWRAELSFLEWRLLRRLPNGATMLAVGRKGA